VSENKKIELIAIKTNDGYYYTDNVQNKSYHNSVMKYKKVDGEDPTKSFTAGWFFAKKIPENITSIKSTRIINRRFELIDETLESEKIPLVFDANTVLTPFGDDSDWCTEYEHLKSLYRYMYDTEPESIVEHEFSFDVIFEYDGSIYEDGFSYSVQRTQFRSDGMINVTEKTVTHQLIDKVVFPDPLLPTKPCKLTSHQSYKIIREHIHKNIDDKVARITSDYEFCFVVAKRVKLVDEYQVRKEILNSRGKSYKKPRYNTNMVKTREVQVFEMTHAGEKYKGYTVIPGFEGNGYEDLKNNIDTFLNALMQKINTPMKECPCCKGLGAIQDD
jgi:hypothetical protein